MYTYSRGNQKLNFCISIQRADEKCLVRCGLVHLLDRLCSLTNYRSDTSNSEAQSMRQRVSAMAWAGFQVLSNRCVMWEQEDSNFQTYVQTFQLFSPLYQAISVRSESKYWQPLLNQKKTCRQ